MIVIGLTGSIACGKSTVSAMLSARGLPLVDADVISRALTKEGAEALAPIRARFGDVVFDGERLDRKALGKIVFANAQARRDLEEILHPRIRREIVTRLAALRNAGARLAVLDVPLLFETGMDELCDEVFCVWVPEDVQLARLMRREGISEEEALARIRAQMPQEIKLEKSQVHIDNSGTVEQTRARVDDLVDLLLGKREEEA